MKKMVTKKLEEKKKVGLSTILFIKKKYYNKYFNDSIHRSISTRMKIKFITLNLWQGGNLFEEIIKFFKKENADILALQEVYDGKDLRLPDKYRSIEVLKKELNYPFHSFSSAFLDIKKFGKIVQGNAVFTNFPIISTNTIFYDVPYGERYEDRVEEFPYNPRNLQHVALKIKNNLINIFNTQGIWGRDGFDNSRRLKMSKIIIKSIKGLNNIILAGDFNLRSNTKTIQNIESCLTNVFKNDLETTFNMQRKTDQGYASAVVDMIFVSKDMKVLNHYCPKVDVSDHLPLVSVLEIT